MLFLNPIFLLGTLLVAGPLLLHLLLRNRPRRQMLPTMRFLPVTSQQTVAMHRFKNLLLLLIRVLIVVLIVQAFSRPYFKRDAPETTKNEVRQGAVFAVDTSLSMRAGGRWDLAQGRVLTLLETLPEPSEIGCVWFDRAPRIALATTRNKALIRDLVERERPGFAGTDLVAAIRSAADLAAQFQAERKTVYVITDFQNSGFRQIAVNIPIPEGVEIVPVAIDPKPAANAAITGCVQIHGLDDEKRILRIQTDTFGSQAITARLSLKAGSRELASRTVKMTPGETVVSDFPVNTKDLGDGILTALLNADDDLDADNTFSIVIREEPPIPVLVMEAAREIVLGGGATTGDIRPGNPYLGAAVRACGNRLRPCWADPATVNASTLADRPVVVVSLSSTLPAGATKSLEAFLREGGCLILFPPEEGGGLDALESLCGLRGDGWERLDAAAGEYRLVSAMAATAQALGDDASDADLLGHPRVTSFLKIAPDALAQAKVLAGLDDGHPFLLECPRGKGVVYLFTTPLDSRATDFPLRAAFTPFLYALMESGLRRSQERTDFLVGDVFLSDAVLTASGDPLRVPSSSTSPARRTERLLQVPGLHFAHRGESTFPVRVLLDPRESDLRPMTAERIEALSGKGRAGLAPRASVERAGLLEPQTPPDTPWRLWWWLLWAALILMAAESVLASRTLR